ncbi:MAG: hypothetical protein EOO38_29595, partial [Cytophagaceae bacterium]
MAVYKLRIFIIAAAITTSLLLLFGAYSQNVITPQNVSDLTKNIAAHVHFHGEVSMRSYKLQPLAHAIRGGLMVSVLGMV